MCIVGKQHKLYGWCESNVGHSSQGLRVPSETFVQLVPIAFLGMVREKRGGKGAQGEGAWSISCSQRTVVISNAFK